MVDVWFWPMNCHPMMHVSISLQVFSHCLSRLSCKRVSRDNCVLFVFRFSSVELCSVFTFLSWICNHITGMFGNHNVGKRILWPTLVGYPRNPHSPFFSDTYKYFLFTIHLLHNDPYIGHNYNQFLEYIKCNVHLSTLFNIERTYSIKITT